MTLQINFKKENQEKILGLVEWMKASGLVISFDINNKIPDNELSKEAIYEIKKGRDDIAAGRVISHAEVEEKLEKWLQAE